MESGARRLSHLNSLKVVIATKNEGKLREMIRAFDGLPVEVLPLSAFGDLPEAVEDGETFADNAIIKARFYSKLTHTAVIADDSGLCVEVLNGAPGVHSARFAGGVHASDVANNEKLLAELSRHGAEESRAAYHCVLVFVDTEGHSIVTEGECAGKVVMTPRGDGGFGYDPYFVPEEGDGRSMAEFTQDEKNAVSHRGKALRLMAKELARYCGDIQK